MEENIDNIDNLEEKTEETEEILVNLWDIVAISDGNMDIPKKRKTTRQPKATSNERKKKGDSNGC